VFVVIRALVFVRGIRARHSGAAFGRGIRARHSGAAAFVF
jgi:hypothetical protein